MAITYCVTVGAAKTPARGARERLPRTPLLARFLPRSLSCVALFLSFAMAVKPKGVPPGLALPVSRGTCLSLEQFPTALDSNFVIPVVAPVAAPSQRRFRAARLVALRVAGADRRVASAAAGGGASTRLIE